jgi:hypothetical protein
MAYGSDFVMQFKSSHSNICWQKVLNTVIGGIGLKLTASLHVCCGDWIYDIILNMFCMLCTCAVIFVKVFSFINSFIILSLGMCLCIPWQ